MTARPHKFLDHTGFNQPVMRHFKTCPKPRVVDWLGTLLYVVFGVTTPDRWMFTLLAILAMMGIGGGISYLFVRLPSGVD